MTNLSYDLIDLKFQKEGFREFISTWLFRYEGNLCIVDPGPTNSLHYIYQFIGEEVPSFCFLTHIHVDHAGGVGELCSKYPEMKVVVSKNAIEHLLNPNRLIEGSLKTLGVEMMQLYGEIKSVPRNQIQDFSPNWIKMIPTPGHASHHVSYVVEDLVFCGEALGVRYGKDYLRPATPIKFNYQVYVDSIKKLSTLKKGTLCFGHFGSEELTHLAFTSARNQIELWVLVVKEGIVQDKDNDQIILDLINWDELFSTFEDLPSDIKNREKSFVYNSIDGIRNYLHPHSS